MGNKQINKQLVLNIILGAILIAIIVYFSISQVRNSINEKKQQELQNAALEGAKFGYEQAIIQVVQQAATCQQVPLIVGNNTLNIIAVDCLQQAQQQR